MSLTTEFVEVKIDRDETYNSFNPKQKGGMEYIQDPNSSSLLHLVKNPKQV